MEYRVIERSSIPALEIKINEMIGSPMRWKPLGGVVVSGNGKYYIQAMVRGL